MSFVLLALKYWKYLAVAGLILLIFWYHIHAINEAHQRGVVETEARWKLEVERETQEANRLVAAEQAKFHEQEEESKKERAANEERERERQEQVAAERDKLNHDYESRLRAELAKNGECAAWSKQLVSCPVR